MFELTDLSNLDEATPASFCLSSTLSYSFSGSLSSFETDRSGRDLVSVSSGPGLLRWWSGTGVAPYMVSSYCVSILTLDFSSRSLLATLELRLSVLISFTEFSVYMSRPSLVSSLIGESYAVSTAGL